MTEPFDADKIAAEHVATPSESLQEKLKTELLGRQWDVDGWPDQFYADIVEIVERFLTSVPPNQVWTGVLLDTTDAPMLYQRIVNIQDGLHTLTRQIEQFKHVLNDVDHHLIEPPTPKDVIEDAMMLGARIAKYITRGDE